MYRALENNKILPPGKTENGINRKKKALIKQKSIKKKAASNLK